MLWLEPISIVFNRKRVVGFLKRIKAFYSSTVIIFCCLILFVFSMSLNALENDLGSGEYGHLSSNHIASKKMVRKQMLINNDGGNILVPVGVINNTNFSKRDYFLESRVRNLKLEESYIDGYVLDISRGFGQYIINHKNLDAWTVSPKGKVNLLSQRKQNDNFDPVIETYNEL